MKTLDKIKQMMADGETAQADEALKELLVKEPGNLQAKMLFGLCRQLLGDEETFKRIHDELAPMTVSIAHQFMYGSSVVIIPMILLALTLCFAREWPLVSLAIIIAIGLTVGVKARKDLRQGTVFGWRKELNPEYYIPIVIEDYAEECCDYSTIKRGKGGSLFREDRRRFYEQCKSEDDIPTPEERAREMAESFRVRAITLKSRFRWRMAFVVLSILSAVTVMVWEKVF